MPTDKEYFADTTSISNSQLRSFVSYNKWGQRLLTPDDYIAMHIDKVIKFEPTDAVIIWKIVDKFFDWTGKNVWNFYIPVARRTGKEIQEVKDKLIKDKTIEYDFEETVENSEIIYLSTFKIPKWEEVICGKWLTTQESIEDLINKYVDENYMEITMSMKDDADMMIARGLSFRKFKNFLKDEWTESQVQLKQNVDIVNKETWEVRTIAMKGKPDFVNKRTKLIVDLKTSWSRDMVIEDLQFRWEPKLTADYIRQLSIYNKLMWGDYDWALALLTANGVKWIFIPNEFLVQAWEILEKDILELDDFIKDPDSIDESIFKQSDYNISLDALGLDN